MTAQCACLDVMTIKSLYCLKVHINQTMMEDDLPLNSFNESTLGQCEISWGRLGCVMTFMALKLNIAGPLCVLQVCCSSGSHLTNVVQKNQQNENKSINK